jgi:serine/threonine-protein kinase
VICGARTSDDTGPGLCEACARTSSSSSFTQSLNAPSGLTGALRGPIPAGLVFGPGQSFGDRYTIVDEVGAGGMGQVYKAIDRNLGRTVALKLIRPGLAARPEALQRFRRELALAQQVTHPNVCRVHDLGEVAGCFYISMEHVDGQTLDDLIRSMGHLSPRQTAALGRQIAAGLQAIHERSIVHRDLKPGNVMVDRSGHALVMDFGMAYHPEADKLTGAGAVMGTLAYLSPEHARGQPTDRRSDIYAVGLILFEMLTGRRPPADEQALPLALRDSGERCPPPSRLVPEVPAALDAVVLRCLEREPGRRFATASDLEHALAQVGGMLTTMSAPLRGFTAPIARMPAWRRLATAAAVTLLLAAVVLSQWPRKRVVTDGRPAAVALVPLAYRGPAQTAYLKDLLPLLLGEELRKASGLQVAPFASSRGYGSGEDPRTVARQLGVGWVLKGEMDVQGERFRGSLRLIGSADGREAWSRDLSGEVGALFPDADRIAADLARALGAEDVAAAAPRRSAEALQRYLEGKTNLEGWDVEKNYLRAEEAFRAAIAAHPDFAEAHAGLAMAAWKAFEETGSADRVERALAEARRAVELAPLLPEAHLALGVVQLGRGQSVEAAASFQKAQALAPGDDAVCRRIADSYLALGRTEDAERLYQRAIDLRPGYWWNHNAKGSFYLQTGRADAARPLFQEVIRLRPEGDIGYSNLGTALIVSGRAAEAEPLLRTALRLHPGPHAHNALGIVYYSTNRFEDAAHEFSAAISSGSEDLTYYGNLGDAHRQLGNWHDAKAAYARAIDLGRRALELNPADGESRASLAMFLAGARECAAARGEAQRATASAEQNPTFHYYLAIAHALCGDRRLALESAVKAVSSGAQMDVRTNPDLRPLLTEPGLQRALMKPPGLRSQ